MKSVSRSVPLWLLALVAAACGGGSKASPPPAPPATPAPVVSEPTPPPADPPAATPVAADGAPSCADMCARLVVCITEVQGATNATADEISQFKTHCESECAKAPEDDPELAAARQCLEKPACPDLLQCMMQIGQSK